MEVETLKTILDALDGATTKAAWVAVLWLLKGYVVPVSITVVIVKGCTRIFEEIMAAVKIGGENLTKAQALSQIMCEAGMYGEPSSCEINRLVKAVAEAKEKHGYSLRGLQDVGS